MKDCASVALAGSGQDLRANIRKMTGQRQFNCGYGKELSHEVLTDVLALVAWLLIIIYAGFIFVFQFFTNFNFCAII
jgi:hypothetical protein